MLLLSSPALAQPGDPWRPHISEESERFGIPEAWIRRVMAVESGGRTRMNGRPIRSSAGAMGLMQLMPVTWQEMRAAHGLGADPDDPRDNLLAGTAYLRSMYERFGYPGLFAAYNAGPRRYTQHLGGRPLPAETVAYVASVAPGLPPRPSQSLGPPEAPPTLFASLSAASPPSQPAVAAQPATAADALFVRLGRTQRR
jgi:soluble lytic murein transglycosylase-like protein